MLNCYLAASSLKGLVKHSYSYAHFGLTSRQEYLLTSLFMLSWAGSTQQDSMTRNVPDKEHYFFLLKLCVINWHELPLRTTIPLRGQAHVQQLHQGL